MLPGAHAPLPAGDSRAAARQGHYPLLGAADRRRRLAPG